MTKSHKIRWKYSGNENRMYSAIMNEVINPDIQELLIEIYNYIDFNSSVDLSIKAEIPEYGGELTRLQLSVNVKKEDY